MNGEKKWKKGSWFRVMNDGMQSKINEKNIALHRDD